MSNYSVSLPPELVKAVDRLLSQGRFKKRSHLVAEALKEYIEFHHPELLAKAKAGPIVLSSIKSRTVMRGPSPRLAGRARLEGFRIED